MFTDRSCYWLWGATIAPIMGSLVGGGLYDVMIFTGGESPVNYRSSYYLRWRSEDSEKEQKGDS